MTEPSPQPDGRRRSARTPLLAAALAASALALAALAWQGAFPWNLAAQAPSSEPPDTRPASGPPAADAEGAGAAPSGREVPGVADGTGNGMAAGDDAEAPASDGGAPAVGEAEPPEAGAEGAVQGGGPGDGAARGPGFTLSVLESMARGRALHPFREPSSGFREAAARLDESDWRGISYREPARLWAGEDTAFEVSFFHAGFIYDRPVRIHSVEGGMTREIAFDASAFDYPDGAGAWKDAVPGFAGFTVHYPMNQAGRMDDAVVFLGANHFRAAARHSRFGETARAVILDPAEPDGEEFPYFSEFWLMRPEPGDQEMTVYALLESRRLVGAMRIVIRPGSSMSMQTTLTLYRRSGEKWPERLGLAPVSGMYLYSEKENGSPYDWRPELHGTDGLVYTDGEGGWFLRALNNPRRLMTTGFPGHQAGGGWGLIQRDNDFDHYQDVGRRYDLRTWVWAEPGPGFPPGSLELIEIPNSQEIHDNIIAYWSVDPAALAGDSLACSYSLFWMPPASNPHNLGRVVSARLLSRTSRDFVEFYLDFD
ncbi:MAG: glucan biosynthesis protein, partial [Deltaproteobacteria bacterium]|nr:glucan biosynthesis protein [Deltaproteobacteria bacterium]